LRRETINPAARHIVEALLDGAAARSLDRGALLPAAVTACERRAGPVAPDAVASFLFT
jgi:hypothetical protein